MYRILTSFWLIQFVISAMFLIVRVGNGMPFNEAGIKFLLAMGLVSGLTALFAIAMWSFDSRPK
jgi:hypothetical protein